MVKKLECKGIKYYIGNLHNFNVCLAILAFKLWEYYLLLESFHIFPIEQISSNEQKRFSNF